MKKKLITRKKNGFTLIELLATIAILAIIMTIAMIFVSNIYSKSKEKANEARLETIKKAARLYFDEKEFNTDQCIIVDDLLKKGYLKANDIKDEKDKYIKNDDASKTEIKETSKIKIELNTYKTISKITINASC